MVGERLIFDFGLHTGRDTEFYLEKGFKVVALEANAALSEACGRRFSDFLSSGQLTIVGKALWHRNEETVSFYINDEKEDWSSLFKGVAEKGQYSAREIRVMTITLSRMIDLYGLPYYAKCDMENADELFARQLLSISVKPRFVSVEVNDCQLPALLYSAGYDRFQIVNQQFHPWTTAPTPPKEGSFVDFKFDGHSTGLFGRELDPDGWLDFGTTVNFLSDLFRLKRGHPHGDRIIAGWFDVHATTEEELARTP